jgi:predicted glycosyltransferase
VTDERETLLFYCQHSLGMGHLVRSLALAASLAERFRVVLLNGGKFPPRLVVPRGVEVVNLPPLGLDPEGRLVSRDGRRTAERARELRRGLIMDAYRRLRPRVILIELFPFGRKKFASELLPLLEAARAEAPPRPLVCCSLRDILVGQRAEQQKHDARVAETANRYFDAVLVHSDPAFARLEESLGSCGALAVPVHYTGFVLPAQETTTRDSFTKGERQILVSAGGGIVGERLFRAAVATYPLLRETVDVTMKLVAGPFLPEAAWRRLRESARRLPGLSIHRFVPDLCAEMRRSAASVSQCGYNTALDILRAGVPALVVPFAEGGEDEQMKRARRLERLGALRVVEQHELDAPRFAQELRGLLTFRPRPSALGIQGARNSARVVESLLRTGTPTADAASRTARVAWEARA